MSQASRRWRDPAPLARPIRWLQWSLAAVGGAMAAFDIARLAFAAPYGELQPVSAAATPLLDQITGVGAVVALVNVLVLLVAGVLSLIWIVRTNANAHVYVRGLKISPGWAAGWFFVPVAGLWKPFQGVSETWRASTNPQGWVALEPPLLLRWWWALFLIDNIAGQISGRLELAAVTIGQVRPAASLSLVSDLTGVALALVFARVVKGLTALQAGRAVGSADADFDASHVFGP